MLEGILFRSFLVSHCFLPVGCVLLSCWGYFLVKIAEWSRVMVIAKKTRLIPVIAAVKDVPRKENCEPAHEQARVGPEQ